MSGSAKKRATAAFRDETHFMTALAEFADAVRPELSFVDARVILTKGGPTRNKGEIKRGINRFILSWDMVALDTYCSRIMEEHDETYTIDMITPYSGEAISHATAPSPRAGQIEWNIPLCFVTSSAKCLRNPKRLATLLLGWSMSGMRLARTSRE